MWTRLRNLRPTISSALLPAGLAAASLPVDFLGFSPSRCQIKPKPSTPLDIRLGLTKAEDVNFRLRWGIIGCGPISSDWCKCLKEVPGAVLESVAARDANKSKEFAKEHGVAKAAASYAELVNDPNVDIVYIGTITPLHKEQTMLAIAAGKHVLCEKPLALTAEDARELYAAADSKGVMLLEGVWTRFFPAVDHARAAVEEGLIGDVKMVWADFPEICYAVQFAPLFLGNEAPSAVVSAGSGAGGAGAVIQYGNRGTAVLQFPPWKAEVPEACEIIGTKGQITLDSTGHSPIRITFRFTTEKCLNEFQGHTATTQNGVQPRIEQYTYPLPDPPGVPAPGWHYANQHGFVYQAEAVHRCLAAGLRECPQYTKKDSLRIMELLDKIERNIHDPCR